MTVEEFTKWALTLTPEQKRYVNLVSIQLIFGTELVNSVSMPEIRKSIYDFCIKLGMGEKV